jgi:hypothetical protein
LIWSVATLANAAETQGLETSHYPGIEHTVQWNSLADNVGCSGNRSVIVKVLPSDAHNPNGKSDMTDSFIVNNLTYNGAPSVTVDTPTGIQIGNVKINYKLTDTESDCCSIIVEYSLDNGAWHEATMAAAGDGKENLASSPSGVSHDFFWDAVSDNVGAVAAENQVKVRITPEDFKQGEPGESGYFSVNNTGANEPPTIEITSGPENGSTVVTKKVTFTYQGTDPEGALAGYYYSFDHDPPNVLTNATSVESDWLVNGEHVFRVVAMDNASAFSDVASRTFTVNAVNLKPTVTILTGPSGETTDNTPTFTYEGADSDGTVTGYYVSIDDSTPDTLTNSTSYTPSALDVGDHTFYVQARDNDGAGSDTADRPFKVVESGVTYDWNIISGDWIIDNATNHLTQTSTTSAGALIIADNINSSSYTLTCQARKNDGGEGFLIIFHWQNENRWLWWNIGSWGNSKSIVEYDQWACSQIVPGTTTSDTVVTGQWYEIKIILNEHYLRGYIDDDLKLDIDMPGYVSSSGSIGFGTWNTASEFKNIQFTPN